MPNPIKKLPSLDFFYDNRTPERNLASGVLLRALLDLLIPAERGRALVWFKYVNKPDEVSYSFKMCCDALDLDPQDIVGLAKRIFYWSEKTELEKGKQRHSSIDCPFFPVIRLP